MDSCTVNNAHDIFSLHSASCCLREAKRRTMFGTYSYLVQRSRKNIIIS